MFSFERGTGRNRLLIDIENKYLKTLILYASVWFKMFEFEACEVIKTRSLLFVNDFFDDKRNKEIEHFKQTLN